MRWREMKHNLWDAGIIAAAGVGIVIFLAHMVVTDWIAERKARNKPYAERIPPTKESVIAKSTEALATAKPKLTLVVNNDDNGKPRAPELPKQSSGRDI